MKARLKNAFVSKLLVSFLFLSVLVFGVATGEVYAGEIVGVNSVIEVAPAAQRNYRVRLVTNTPASCSGVYDAAGYTVVKRCSDCYRQIRTTDLIANVRNRFNQVIQGTPVTSAEVNTGTC